MAMPLTPAAAPMPADAAMPPAGADMPMDDAGEGAEPEVIATICKNADGTYMLYAGDEPDMDAAPAEPGMSPGDEPAAPEGKTFDTPQALLRGVMELLNSDGGAEDAFAGGFKGDSASPPMK